MKHLRKILSVVLAAAMLFSFSVTALAEDAANITMTASASSVKENETVYVTITADKDITAIGAGITVKYDSSVFEVDADHSSASGRLTVKAGNSNVKATCLPDEDSPFTISAGENIAVFAFKAIAKSDSAAFTMSELSVYDSVSTKLALTIPEAVNVAVICNHNYTSETTDPTCTADGVKTFICSKCGDSYTETVPTTGHTASAAVTENEVAATCSAAGSYDSVVYCSVCETEMSRDTVTVPANGHTLGEAVEENRVEATADVDGSYDTVVYCSVCGEEISRNTVVIPATGHTAGEAVIENEVAATCTEDGSYDSVIYCTDTECGKELSRETVTVPATGHTAGEPVTENEVAATCTEDGSYDTVVYCTVCEEEVSCETVTVPAAGHSYDENGVCTDCGAEDPNAQPDEPDTPDEPETPSKPGNNWLSGLKNWFDKWFGGSDDDEPEDPDTHKHSYTCEVTKEATCTEKGEKTYTCECGDSYTKEIPATGHSYKNGVCTDCGAEKPSTGNSWMDIIKCWFGNWFGR